MNIAKEKAKELVDKYYNLFSVELENTIDYREAKQCALIAWNEMYDICAENDNVKKLNFLVDVEYEIQKL
jgi:hypothetical protein